MKGVKIIALGALLVATNMFAKDSLADSFLQKAKSSKITMLHTSIGFTNFKELDKKEATLNLKGLIKIDNLYNIASLTLSKSYKDIELQQIAYKSRTVNFFGSVAVGYLMHDLYIHKNKVSYLTNTSDPEAQPVKVVTDKKSIETQKAPYASLKATFYGFFPSKEIATTLTVAYKLSLDRGDLKDGYSFSSQVIYNNISGTLSYEKLNFNGADNQKDLKLMVGYTFLF